MARSRARNARVRSLIEIIIDHRNPRATGYLKKAYLPGDQSTTSRVWVACLIPRAHVFPRHLRYILFEVPTTRTEKIYSLIYLNTNYAKPTFSSPVRFFWSAIGVFWNWVHKLATQRYSFSSVFDLYFRVSEAVVPAFDSAGNFSLSTTRIYVGFAEKV